MKAVERFRESSQYLSTLLRRSPNFVEWLLPGGNLFRRYALAELYEDLTTSTGQVGSFGELLSRFREFKQRHFLRIGGRDLLGLATLAETTGQLSDLAGVALQVGLDALIDHSEWWLSESERNAWSRLQGRLPLVVIGFGKLGGHELNYVSDIDILYLYDQECSEGHWDSDSLVLLNRFCHWHTRLLSDRVDGDRVFTVDLRLRPQGKDGTLVHSSLAAAEYYLQYGRPWERLALLKARPVAGVRSLGAAFLRDVRPFVFRRFLDFQAIDELRSMRDRILAEALRPASGWQQFDVKLGVGGIREIEFFVQSLQLVYGGRSPELDEPNTLKAIDALYGLKLIAQGVAEQLKQTYVFLRRVEHWVQLDQNRQTQKIPQSEEARERLAFALGFEGNVTEFLKELEKCCALVHEHFRALFEPMNECVTMRSRGLVPEDEPCEISWPDMLPQEPVSRLTAGLSLFPAAVREGVPKALREFASVENPEAVEKALARLDRYFAQVKKRPGLIRVFDSSSAWIEGFCRAVAQSELLSHLLTSNPSLVEGVATAAGKCPGTLEWQSTAERLLATTDDYEQSLEWIRRFKNERMLQLGIADLRGEINHDTLELELTAVADFVIRHTYDLILKNRNIDPELPLSILGLGKLGSREMGYLSDLDLVFVYQPRAGESEEQIPENVVRLVQRFMRMISTPLHEGQGYSVDARLRPTGNYGPLIVTRRSWLEYYSEQADLWEIQALLRLRGVAGDPDLGRWLEEKGQEICYQQREPGIVWQRLCHLRSRMQYERADEKQDVIDIKLGLGGLADLEFLVQGHQLTEGFGDPALRSASVRSVIAHVLRRVSESCVECNGLEAAFDDLRSLEHRMRILTDLGSSRLNPSQFEMLRTLMLWPPSQGTSLVETWEDLLRFRRSIRAALRNFCPGLV